MDGIVRTRVGYAGGTKKNPTYHSLGDHTETIQIDFDPERITYERLLGVFWASHDPTSRSWSRQYKAVVFYHDQEQRNLAAATRDRLAERTGAKIHTEILPYEGFYLAEAYHQKYRLRSVRDIMAEFNAMYPLDDDFVNSTAAARVNGYVGGYGSLEVAESEMGELGLSPDASRKLLEIVAARRR
jgi:peptide-methionine (S)-S-oxide reductase